MTTPTRARVIGTVRGRREALALVRAEDGHDVRVRWRSTDYGKGRTGHHCATCGWLERPDWCDHIEAARVAWYLASEDELTATRNPDYLNPPTPEGSTPA